MRIIRCLSVLFVFAVCGFCAEATGPVYVYLFGSYSDFVNIDLTEARIRDTVALAEKYRKEYPQFSVTMLFSGASSQKLAERNASTGIKDFIVDAARRGLVELGYDGADEPTYSFRPMANLANAKTPSERWSARAGVAERILTESRDMASGAVQKGKSGGLKAMQEVFGKAVCIKGLTDELGGDSEYVHHLRRLNTHALMWGLPETPPTTIPGYRGSVLMVGEAMTPIPNSAPEMYWMDGFLRIAEWNGDTIIRPAPAYRGVDELRKMLDKVGRSRVHIVQVEVADQRAYLSDFYNQGELYPPLKVAYLHPDRGTLPVEAFAGETAKRQSLARQDELLKWFGGAFAQANGGSRFVSSTDLMRMSPSNEGQNISVAELRKAVGEWLKNWSVNTHPPDFLTLNRNQYLSLAETFQVLCDVLAEENRTGKKPDTVQVRQVFGPLTTPEEHGPAIGTVTGVSVARLAAQLAASLHDTAWKPVPANMIPYQADIGGSHVTGGQLLRLMAEAAAAPTLETKLNIAMTYLHSGSGLGYPKMRLPIDQGGTWTFKPAPLAIPAATHEKP